MHGDRRGHRRRPPALPLRGRGRRRHARRARSPTHRATRFTPSGPSCSPSSRSRRTDVPAVEDPTRSPAAPAGRAEHLLQGVGLRAVRPVRRLGHGRASRQRRGRRAADAVGARDRRGARRRRRARRARSAPRRRRGGLRRRRSTSPAAAPSRPRSRTASTSATRSARAPPTRCARRSRAWPRPARRSARPVVSGNVSLYNESGGSADPPDAASSAASGVLERAASAVPIGAGRRERLAVPARRAGAGLRRLGVAGTRLRRERRAHPRGRPARAALAVRPARRTRARGRRPALGPRRLRRRPRGRAGRGWRWPPAAASRLRSSRAAATRRRCSASAAAWSSRAARPRTRRAWPRRATLRACPSSKSVRWAARRSRCAAASSRSTLPVADARAAYEDTLPQAMAAG